MTAFRTGGPVRAKANLFGDDVPRRNRPATASPDSRTASPSRPTSRPPSPGPRDDRRGPVERRCPPSRNLTQHMRRAPSPTPAFNKSAPGKPRWRS